jgi:NAD(P)-dependent dehydrogenase (short-subunit alcohol dehydrogenase family)
VLANRLQEELDDQPAAGVLSLLALNEEWHSHYAALPTGLIGTLVLTQALGDIGIIAPLWCVTQGAVSVGTLDPLSSPVQSAVWGLGRAAAVEHPERWGGLIDLPELVNDRIGTWLSAILSGVGDEDQVAVRDSGIFVRRLIRAPLSDQPAALWKPLGSVLITGGTGGVGGQVARWLASRGVDHLILASRRGAAAPEAAALCRELEVIGTEVKLVACDVSDREALVTLLADIPAEHPLTAVIHCAGVLDDGVLDELTPQQLESVLQPKMKAAFHLHELTRDLHLSAFVVLSSCAGLIAAPGQANCAAANAFLDAFTHHRLAHGLPATCLAWGLWAGDGVRGNANEEQLRRRGILAMDLRLAITAMGQALDHDESSLLIAKFDWESFLSWLTAVRPSPLFDQIPEAQWVCQRVGTSNGIDDVTAKLRSRLATMSEAEQEYILLEMVRAEAATILEYPSPAKIIDTRAFHELGFSSPDVLELRHRLGVLTGIGLADTVVYEYPSPAALARYLRAQLTHSAAQKLSVSAEIDRLEEAFIRTADDGERSAAVARLHSVLTRWDKAHSPGDSSTAIEMATADELFDLIDNELGKS